MLFLLGIPELSLRLGVVYHKNQLIIFSFTFIEKLNLDNAFVTRKELLVKVLKFPKYYCSKLSLSIKVFRFDN